MKLKEIAAIGALVGLGASALVIDEAKERQAQRERDKIFANAPVYRMPAQPLDRCYQAENIEHGAAMQADYRKKTKEMNELKANPLDGNYNPEKGNRIYFPDLDGDGMVCKRDPTDFKFASLKGQ